MYPDGLSVPQTDPMLDPGITQFLVKMPVFGLYESLFFKVSMGRLASFSFLRVAMSVPDKLDFMNAFRLSIRQHYS